MVYSTLRNIHFNYFDFYINWIHNNIKDDFSSKLKYVTELQKLRNYKIFLNKFAAEPNICTSQQCLSDSSRILGNIDRSINPCQDFYTFACGGFFNKSILFPDQEEVSIYSLANDRLLVRLYDILNYDVDDNKVVDEPKPYKLAKTLFRRCNDEQQIRSYGLDPIRHYVLHKFGMWPVIKGDAWNGTTWTWQKYLMEFKAFGVHWKHIFDVTYKCGNKCTKLFITVSINLLLYLYCVSNIVPDYLQVNRNE